ncbi:hypothetical protein F4779DRAFT_64469 [Xylariaceae sp. FL0662B]|nr:hypothetical protein F4779DRAFT_64469 [Xylariaceae sp. FL0662B]
MQVLPFVSVRDLPSSASFYSAITQPLKLRYISANSSSIVYGDTTSSPPDAVFEVKKVGANQQLRPSRLVLSAHSPSVVSAFRAAALRANPDLVIDGGGDSRAVITDPDGNRMEVVHRSPPDNTSSYGGSTVRGTQSTSEEVSRILDWNLGVANSVPSKSVVPSAAGGALTPLEPQPLMRRSLTTSTLEAPPRDPPRDTQKGLSTGAVIGTVLGAAAVGAAVGGALSYTMMRNDRQRTPHQEYDAQTSQRRASYPDPHPNHRPRYVEIERTVEKIHYPEENPSRSSKKYPPSSRGARYSQVDGPARSRVMEDIDDRASQRSSHYTTGSRARRRSEAGSVRRPLMITDVEHRSNSPSDRSAAPRLLMDAEYKSQAGSKYTGLPKFTADDDRRSYASSKHTVTPSKHNAAPSPSRHTAAPSRYMTETDYRSRASSRYTTVPRPAEAETWVSARTDASASTIRPAAPRMPTVETMPPTRAQSRAPTRYSTATARRPGLSRTTSQYSARHLDLPDSQAGWEDDIESVAPSDSISCIGNRQSRWTHRD